MAASRSGALMKPAQARWVMAGLVAAALVIHIWGMRRNLPFTPEIDEPIYVTRAVTIAASGYLNPGWFGNPGSTVMYPLAASYHLWNAARYGGPLLRADAGVSTRFHSGPAEFYFIGRLLTISYAVMSVVVVYLAGRRAFGQRVALVGSALWVCYPLAVAHAQMVRSDSAAVFFGMLALWLCLRLYERPTVGNHVMTGVAIGLGVATRYFMVSLVPVLLAVDALVLWRGDSRAARLRSLWPAAALGLLAVVAAFAISTPYFFRDFATAVNDLRFEAERTHLGADGLSFAGNLLWYLTKAIPQAISWPQMVLAAAGVALMARRREPQQLLLLGFVAIFLAGISLSHLHWQRWVIQVLPLFALMAAYALDEAAARLAEHSGWGLSSRRALLLAMVLLVSAWPAYNLAMFDIGVAGSSARLLARDWVAQNLPPGSRIAQDRYGAPLVRDDFFGHPPERYSGPLPGNDFIVYERYSLAPGRSPDDYYRDGYRYLVVSSAMYERYLAEPARYASEAGFYRELFRDARLLQHFGSPAGRGGFEKTAGHLLQPDVRIYQLQER